MNDNVVAIRPRKQAIWKSYAAAGDALQRPCGHCGAPVGQFCMADDGRRLRRVPCVSRCRGEGSVESPRNDYAPVDFSEPRHPVDA